MDEDERYAMDCFSKQEVVRIHNSDDLLQIFESLVDKGFLKFQQDDLHTTLFSALSPEELCLNTKK